MDNKTIGKNIREARLWLGLRREEVAKILNYGLAKIILIEEFGDTITEEDLLNFSKLYRVSKEDFLKEHNFNMPKDQKAIAELIKFKEEIKNEQKKRR